MEKTIPCTFEDRHGIPMEDDSIVEYCEYMEDGQLVREITFIFLPDGVPKYSHDEVKKQIAETFHYGAMK